MKNFISSALKAFKGSVKAFKKYPIVIVNALAFSVVTIIRIYLAWPEQEAYIFLFNCLHLSFAFGAIFSLTVISFAQIKYNNKKMFIIANFLGCLATISTFIILRFFSGIEAENLLSSYQKISSLAIARVSAAMFVSFLIFIILAGLPKTQSDFSKAFFMVHKAFFIALIYGLVIMGGTSGVAGAVKALLYRGLTSKIYGYIATLSGFLAFTIFVGYFPDFSKDVIDKQREVAQKQPKFIEILFGYIITLIMLALTGVLVLWACKTIIEGMDVPFIRLSSIASAFAIGGIWLHIMVNHNETGPTKFYKKTYPVVVIFILFFEAWALIAQLQKHGLKTAEYFFLLIWVFALHSSILLIIKKDKAYNPIIMIIITLTIISVLPYIGYNSIPFRVQINRLENLLTKEGILQQDRIVPTTKEPEENIRQAITDSVLFLANSENILLPPWFNKELKKGNLFKENFGFEQTFPKTDTSEIEKYASTYLNLSEEAIDISEYRWGVNMDIIYTKEDNFISIKEDNDIYKIYWEENRQDGIPSLKVLLDEKPIIDLDMNEYISNILSKFPVGEKEIYDATLEDMSIRLETPQVKVMIVFSNIYIHKDLEEDELICRLNPTALYFGEK